jgi:hypothetical protein
MCQFLVLKCGYDGNGYKKGQQDKEREEDLALLLYQRPCHCHASLRFVLACVCAVNVVLLLLLVVEVQGLPDHNDNAARSDWHVTHDPRNSPLEAAYPLATTAWGSSCSPIGSLLTLLVN